MRRHLGLEFYVSVACALSAFLIAIWVLLKTDGNLTIASMAIIPMSFPVLPFVSAWRKSRRDKAKDPTGQSDE